MTEIRIVGWKRGLKAVSLVEAIRDHSTGSLAEAKRCLDQVLDGQEVVLRFETPEHGRRFRRLAEEYGAIVAPSA